MRSVHSSRFRRGSTPWSTVWKNPKQPGRKKVCWTATACNQLHCSGILTATGANCQHTNRQQWEIPPSTLLRPSFTMNNLGSQAESPQYCPQFQISSKTQHGCHSFLMAPEMRCGFAAIMQQSALPEPCHPKEAPAPLWATNFAPCRLPPGKNALRFRCQ